MRNAILLVLAYFVTGTPPAEAQMRGAAPRTWIAGYGLMYTSLNGFFNPGTESDWVFDDNVFGFGAALQRDVTPGLQLGVDVSLARPEYERRPRDGGAVVGGTASVGTAMLNGRVGQGGGSEFGFYLTGGLGTIAYRLEDLGEWNADFALRAGTGLEYRMTPSRAAYLEWSRIWGHHERDDLGGGSVRHSVLQLGLRLGL